MSGTQSAGIRGQEAPRLKEDQGTPRPLGPHRQNVIFKVLPSLLPGTPLLTTLPFQVPRGEQLQVPVIGSRNPATAAQESLGLWGVQKDFWAQRTEKWRVTWTGDMEEPEPKGRENPRVLVGEGTRCKGSWVRGRWMSAPGHTHLGLALHRVQCPSRWSIPGIAAAKRGGPSYFVDTWNRCGISDKCLGKELGKVSLTGLWVPLIIIADIYIVCILGQALFRVVNLNQLLSPFYR